MASQAHFDNGLPHSHFSDKHHEPQHTAEEYAADAMAADMDMWLTYVPSQGKEPIEEWLASNLPSQVSRDDGIGWIHVCSPGYSGVEDSVRDVVGLQQSWEHLKSSGRTINQQTITEIAKMHSVTTGKWLFHTSTGLKVDHLWSLVAKGVVEGRCGISAKVSPFNPNDEKYHHNKMHVICIYNSDFTDYNQVLQLENSIRTLGIKCTMSYKPDAYTMVGVYRNNEWGVPPTIYRSVFDILAGCSKISDAMSFSEMSHENNSIH